MLEALVERLLRAFFGPAVESFPAPPHAFDDAEGRGTEVRAFRAVDLDPLVETDFDFDPAQRAQGTPPIGEEAVRGWLDGALGEPSTVAWYGDRAVGHVTFVPDGSADTSLPSSSTRTTSGRAPARGSSASCSGTRRPRASSGSGSRSSPGSAGARSSTATSASTPRTRSAWSPGCPGCSERSPVRRSRERSKTRGTGASRIAHRRDDTPRSIRPDRDFHGGRTRARRRRVRDREQ